MQFGEKKRIFTMEDAPRLWFLVEVFNDVENDKMLFMSEKQYIILHPLDFLETETTSTHAEGFVRFCRNEILMEGRIIFSAPNRDQVMGKLLKILKPMRIKPIEEWKSAKYFLVQFHTNNNSIAQTVVKEDEVFWPNSMWPNRQEVLIKDGGEKRVATVLFDSEDKNQVISEFHKLKKICCEKVFDASNFKDSITDEHWMLGLYSCRPNFFIYTIIKARDAFRKRNKCFKDSVAYIKDGCNDYECNIIRVSKSYEELLVCLNVVDNTCLTTDFPLSVDVCDKDALPPPATKCQDKLNSTVLELEHCIRAEAAALSEFIDSFLALNK